MYAAGSGPWALPRQEVTMSVAVRQLGGRRLAPTAALAFSLSLLLLCGWLWAPPARAYGSPPPITIPLFPADNPWNTDISHYPVDANSDAYIASIGAGVGLHPDFGTDWEGGMIGIPYAVVPGTQPKVPISFYYADESDPGPYPIPPDVPIQGGPDSSGDRHVIVLDADDHLLYEVYDAHKVGDHWEAGSGAVFDLTSNALRPDGWTSADAAGLPILPGLVRYEEVQAGAIDHALRFTVEQTQRAYIYPATHFASDSTDPNLPPMGLRLRLKAGYDISGFPPDVQVILQALKTYGMMVADNGSNWFISGTHDPRWNDEELHVLDEVKGRDFEVVDTSSMGPGVLTVRVGGAARLREGAALVRQGSFSDTRSSGWTATVDYGDGSGPQPLALTTDKHFTLAHTYGDDGRYTVVVAITGDVGLSGSARLAVRVREVAPKVRAGADTTLRPGTVFVRAGSFTDPGAESWRGWVRWGAGSGRRQLVLRADKTFVLRHVFPRRPSRSYKVTVTVRDDDGARGVGTFRVRVR
jgi:hypothetical protein